MHFLFYPINSDIIHQPDLKSGNVCYVYREIKTSIDSKLDTWVLVSRFVRFIYCLNVRVHRDV